MLRTVSDLFYSAVRFLNSEIDVPTGKWIYTGDSILVEFETQVSGKPVGVYPIRTYSEVSDSVKSRLTLDGLSDWTLPINPNLLPLEFAEKVHSLLHPEEYSPQGESPVGLA